MITPSRVIVLEQVGDDLNIGKAFYAGKESWLGDYFWDSLLGDIESLYLYAGIHPKHGGLYRLLSRKFPYSIYYEIDGSLVVVIAVLPMRRDPDWIGKQLKERR